MSDSEADEKSYESYDNNSDDDFKEDFDDDEEYDEPSVKPRIKIGPIIDEDVADDQEEMEYAGMDSDDEDDVFGDMDAPAYPPPPPLGDPEEEDDTDDDIDYNRDSPTQVGRVIGVDQGVQPEADEEDVDSDDDESSDEEEEGFFQKLDKEVLSNYIDIFHPESRVHNYDEVRTLAKVTRNNEGAIVDELHRTLPFLTKFEKAKILGLRSKQLNEGAKPFIQTPPNVVTGYAIAIMELAAKKIPFIIRRPIPNGGSEYWRVSDLELIN